MLKLAGGGKPVPELCREHGISCVVLAMLAAQSVGGNEFGCHQFDGVAVLLKQPCPVMGAGAGFDADQAGGESGNQ